MDSSSKMPVLLMDKFANKIMIAAPTGVSFKDIFGQPHVKQHLIAMEIAPAMFAEPASALQPKTSST